MFFTLRFILQAVQRSARFRLCPVKTKRCGTVHPPFYKAVRTFIRCAGTVFPYMGAAAPLKAYAFLPLLVFIATSLNIGSGGIGTLRKKASAFGHRCPHLCRIFYGVFIPDRFRSSVGKAVLIIPTRCRNCCR